MTPITEKPIALDNLEADLRPHEGQPPPIDEQLDTDDEPKHVLPKRLRITLDDLKQVGFTPNCPKCNLHRAGETYRAAHSHHAEQCRHRVCNELRRLGSLKVKHADSSGRTTSRSASSKDPIPSGRDEVENAEEFSLVVDQDDVLLKDLVGDAAVPDAKACAFVDMLDVLQIMGVDPVCPLRFACGLNSSDHVTFMENYGQ